MRKEEGQFKALLLCASYGVLFSFLPFPILLFLLPTKYSTARSPAKSPAALLKIRYSFSTLLVNFPIYVTPFL